MITIENYLDLVLLFHFNCTFLGGVRVKLFDCDNWSHWITFVHSWWAYVHELKIGHGQCWIVAKGNYWQLGRRWTSETTSVSSKHRLDTPFEISYSVSLGWHLSWNQWHLRRTSDRLFENICWIRMSLSTRICWCLSTIANPCGLFNHYVWLWRDQDREHHLNLSPVNK